MDLLYVHSLPSIYNCGSNYTQNFLIVAYLPPAVQQLLCRLVNHCVGSNPVDVAPESLFGILWPNEYLVSRPAASASFFNANKLMVSAAASQNTELFKKHPSHIISPHLSETMFTRAYVGCDYLEYHEYHHTLPQLPVLLTHVDAENVYNSWDIALKKGSAVIMPTPDFLVAVGNNARLGVDVYGLCFTNKLYRPVCRDLFRGDYSTCLVAYGNATLRPCICHMDLEHTASWLSFMPTIYTWQKRWELFVNSEFDAELFEGTPTNNYLLLTISLCYETV